MKKKVKKINSNQKKRYTKKSRNINLNKREKKKILNSKEKINLNKKTKREKFENNNKNKEKLNSCPKTFYFFEKQIINDSINEEDNHLIYKTFIIFNSINNILLLIYINKNNYIVSYNLINFSKISEIKRAHQNEIKNVKYIFDNKNKRDLVMTNSAYKIKVWNNINWECLFQYDSRLELISSFLYDKNNNIYIILNSPCHHKSIPFSVYDINKNKNKIKEIKSEDKFIHYFETFYDIKLSKSYFITSSANGIISYNFDNNKIHHKYRGASSFGPYKLFIIYNKKEIVKLIGSVIGMALGAIKIWDFHRGEILYTINILPKLINTCLWNNRHLITLSMEYKKIYEKYYTISFIDLKEVFFGNNLIISNKDDFMFIEKFIHPKYGECLMTMSNNGEFKLLIQNKK